MYPFFVKKQITLVHILQVSMSILTPSMSCGIQTMMVNIHEPLNHVMNQSSYIVSVAKYYHNKDGTTWYLLLQVYLFHKCITRLYSHKHDKCVWSFT